MDLGTVKEKLKKGEYKTLFQVGEEVRLVWTNCMTYNADGSDFYKLADSLHKKWDEKYNKLLAECSTAGGEEHESAKVSLEDRRNFAKSLFSLSKEDLGRVLVEVESKSPLAITRNATEDEVDLNVDKIPGSVLKDLTKFIAGAKDKNKKKAAPPAKKTKTG